MIEPSSVIEPIVSPVSYRVCPVTVSMSLNNYNSGRQEVQQRSFSDNNRLSGGSVSKKTRVNNWEGSESQSLEQLEFSPSTMSQAFYSYGKFCVCHPWEVIVAFFTLSICAISIGSRRGQLERTTSSIPCTNIPCPSKVSSAHPFLLSSFPPPVSC